ncbi:hypothetical protein B0H14DRAFT_3455664 [Mycena olivaceomarginata]|nr:hypothetical protein B0H14DRAFT_3455664 [Mycena olivaceomarginata]
MSTNEPVFSLALAPSPSLSTLRFALPFLILALVVHSSSPSPHVPLRTPTVPSLHRRLRLLGPCAFTPRLLICAPHAPLFSPPTPVSRPAPGPSSTLSLALLDFVLSQPPHSPPSSFDPDRMPANDQTTRTPACGLPLPFPADFDFRAHCKTPSELVAPDMSLREKNAERTRRLPDPLLG